MSMNVNGISNEPITTDATYKKSAPSTTTSEAAAAAASSTATKTEKTRVLSMNLLLIKIQ